MTAALATARPSAKKVAVERVEPPQPPAMPHKPKMVTVRLTR
jgi:hypothetical protein